MYGAEPGSPAALRQIEETGTLQRSEAAPDNRRGMRLFSDFGSRKNLEPEQLLTRKSFVSVVWT